MALTSSIVDPKATRGLVFAGVLSVTLCKLQTPNASASLSVATQQSGGFSLSGISSAGTRGGGGDRDLPRRSPC